MTKKYLKLLLTFPYWIPLFIVMIISGIIRDYSDAFYGSFYDWIHKDDLEEILKQTDSRNIYTD